MLDLENWNSPIGSHMAVSFKGHSVSTSFDSAFTFREITQKTEGGKLHPQK